MLMYIVKYYIAFPYFRLIASSIILGLWDSITVRLDLNKTVNEFNDSTSSGSKSVDLQALYMVSILSILRVNSLNAPAL